MTDTSSRVSRETFSAWNDAMARKHDPDLYHTASPWPVRWLERSRVRQVITLLDVERSSRVLEVGCGAGNILELVSSDDRVGVDLSPFLLEKARARLGPSVTLSEMNAEALTFQDASFDRVYCSEVLEHVIDPGQVLAEMHRVLRPNGVAVVSVPDERAINRLKGLVFSVPGARRAVRAISGYVMPERMEDEWHLHEVDSEMLRALVAPYFRVDRLVGVPNDRIALRWVARLIPR